MEEIRDEIQSEKKKSSFGIYQVLIILVIAYICFLLYQSLYSNYRTRQEINSLKQDVAVLQGQKEELEVLTAYYQTDTFQELEARKKLGLKVPGEKVAKVEEVKEATPTPDQQQKAIFQGSQKANWEQWLDFLKGAES